MQRRTPLKRTPFRAKPPKRKDPKGSKAEYEAVAARSGGVCEIGEKTACTLRATDMHHVKLRSRGGTDDRSNLLHGCHECHMWVHQHPALAALRGWMKSAWE